MKKLIIVLAIIALSACSPEKGTKSPSIENLQTITDMGIAID